ncbi:MAG TPA: methyltransferase domain-containing protein [Gaiellaceae bacterium]|nr:methyltransferase domain-containing protein [Gaiellaceae bacterium]
MRIDPVAAAGFGAAAEVYERARPSYPPEAIDWLLERTGIGPGDTIVDLGAGTGKLTRLLLASGARVVAVEPIAEMRALIGVEEAIDGTAEDIPLPDGAAALVTVAQAFHWFDLDRALPEIHRVLRPGGALALVWNMRDLDDPLQRGVEELLAPLRGRLGAQREGKWRAPLAASPLFGDPETAEFRHAQLSTAADVQERVASTSFVAAMSEHERRPVLDQVRTLVGDQHEPFPFPYVTEVLLIPRTP